MKTLFKIALFCLLGLIALAIVIVPPQDCETAWSASRITDCYKAKAESGDINAQYNLGARFLGAKGVEPNEEIAVKWFKVAAEKGHTDAQRRLGNAYSIGAGGVALDIKKAEYWWVKSAKAGNIEAEMLLGEKYFEGDGLEKSDKKSFEWYLKAASNGDHHAQMIVGNFYAVGRVVKLDYTLAYAWLILAVEGNDPDSIEEKDQYKHELSAEARVHAEKMAANWTNGHIISY